MIVDQIEAFKSWLTAVLKPMCEADPAALAKYVLALIKKDKSEAELRKSMVGQLEVFLEGETENFVNLVFQTLTTKDYITTPVIPNANPPNPINPTKPKEGRETKVIVPPSELPNLSEVVNGNNSEKKEVKKEVKSRRNSENGDKEERPARRRSRHRSLSRNRSKSRSRSWDRVKRSRSRDKSRDRVDRESHRLDREKRDRGIERDRVRPWRNKSPTRRYDRRRSRSPRSGSPPRLRSRSRSPRHSHRNRYRGSRSRSRSIEKKDRKDSKDVKTHSRPGTPIQDADADLVASGAQTVPSVIVQPNASKRRCRDFDEKGYCMRGEMCPFDHGVDPVVLEDSTLTRVLSYNPNGDVTGPLAGGAAITAVPIPPGTTGAPRHPVDNPYNPQAPQMWSGGRFRGPRPMGGVRLPGINPFSQPPPVIGMQRELIPVPLVMDNMKPPGVNSAGGYAPAAGSGFVHHPNTAAPPQSYGPGIPIPHHALEGAPMHTGKFKKKFDFNRLGPRKHSGNCSLELKKVPPGMNTITHLNNHFSKFGKIVNIQVNYEGDAEAALITFSNPAEANSAYKSTEAVLNNRFIKMFWHDSDSSKQENVPPVQQNALQDSLVNVPPNSNKVLNLLQPKADKSEGENKGEKSELKPELSKEETKAQATAAIQKYQDFLAVQAKMNKNKDEQRKEVLQIQSNLRKRKQELLDKQLSQQKILVDKMSKLPPGPQRDVIKETIKKTQEAIEGIKKDLELAALAAKSAVGVTKSKEEAQKEILDMELDLIAKQQEGTDTSELLKKMSELKAKTAFMGFPNRGRGRSSYNPISSRHLVVKHNFGDKTFKPTGKIKTVNKIINNAPTLTPTPALPLPQVTPVASFQKHVVDHRPTRLLVSGYETDEQEAVVTHFKQFGEVVDYSIDSSLPSITLNYKTRNEAESALLKGKHFQDRTLSITWQSGPPNRLQTQKSGGSSTRTILLSESDEDHLIDQSLIEGDEELGPETEEALLQDDEEEDEEDRSWRR